MYIDRFNQFKEQEFHFSYDFDIHFYKESKSLSVKQYTSSKVKLFYEDFLNINDIIVKNGRWNKLV